MATSPGVPTIPANLVATIPGKSTTLYKQVNAPAGMKYWVLTAYTAELESGPSNEVSYQVKLKPPSVLGSSVTVSFGDMRVTIIRR
jgi:hypothetical protein